MTVPTDQAPPLETPLTTRVSPATLREWFHYDQRTGTLRWRQSPTRAVKPGDIAGTWRASNRRLTVTFRGCIWPVHELVWYMSEGSLPEGGLAFRDGNPRNMRWANLIERRYTLSRTPSARYQRKRRREERQLIEKARRLGDDS